MSEFITAHRAEILAAVEMRIRALPVARGLDPKRRLDHLPHLLDRIRDALESSDLDEALGHVPETHALERLDIGFDLGVLAAEYGVLRECVLELYRQEFPASPWEQVGRFNAAIDRAVAVAVDRYGRARERTLIALDRISQAALASDRLEHFLPKLMQALLESTEDVDSVSLLVRKGDWLYLRAAVGVEEAALERGFSVRIGEGFAGRIASEKQPRAVRHAATAQDVQSEALQTQGVRALYGVPLLENGEVIAVAKIASRTAFEFSNDDKLLFRTMATRAEQVLAQARMRDREAEARAELDALFAGSPSGMAVLDTEFRFVRLNHAFAALIGVTPDRATGERIFELVPDLQPRLGPGFQRILDSGEPLAAFELDVPGRGIFLVSSYPIRPDGAAIGIGVFLLDFTERKQNEQALRRKAGELEEAADFRDRVLAVLGHDLRNPLATIKMGADLLIKKGHLPEGMLGTVVRISRAAQRIQDILTGLLDFTHARFVGLLSIKREPLDLASVVRETVEELRISHPEGLIQIEAPPECHGEWDRSRMAQIVSNLATNAIQHGLAGGIVAIQLEDHGEWVVLRVHNQGDPIPSSLLPVIFEPFRRGAAKEDRAQSRGFGLGLYIVRQIVLAHRGEISIDSSPGRGTTFSVRLPRR